MFPTPPTQTGGLAPEAVNGDSLTQSIKALVNYLQSQGQGTFNSGQNVFNQGANTTAQGADVVGQAGKTLQPTIDYWSALLSGDPTKMTQAVAPTATAIGNQYDAAQRGVQTGSARGGFSAGMAANLPFQKAGQVGNLFSQLQPLAAQNLQGAAGTQAGIGSALGGVGTQIAQQGLGESGLGFNMFNLGANTQLGRRGQNVQQESLNPVNKLLGSLGSLPGAVAGAAAGGGLAKLFPGIFGGG